MNTENLVIIETGSGKTYVGLLNSTGSYGGLAKLSQARLYLVQRAPTEHGFQLRGLALPIDMCSGPSDIEVRIDRLTRVTNLTEEEQNVVLGILKNAEQQELSSRAAQAGLVTAPANAVPEPTGEGVDAMKKLRDELRNLGQ